MQYLGTGRHAGRLSELAYHNSLMVQVWSMLATGNVVLARHALAALPPTPATGTWICYVRCHDDIGWAIDDGDARAVGLDGYAHRRFLSEWYAGAFAASWARGLVFQHNPATGDKRISGTAASLTGLADAVSVRGRTAASRMFLAHAMVAGWGGIPVVWSGDELGMASDPHWSSEPGHEDDNRWAHRPRLDWARAQRREDLSTVEGRVFQSLAHLGRVRSRLHSCTQPPTAESCTARTTASSPSCASTPAGPWCACTTSRTRGGPSCLPPSPRRASRSRTTLSADTPCSAVPTARSCSAVCRVVGRRRQFRQLDPATEPGEGPGVMPATAEEFFVGHPEGLAIYRAVAEAMGGLGSARSGSPQARSRSDTAGLRLRVAPRPVLQRRARCAVDRPPGPVDSPRIKETVTRRRGCGCTTSNCAARRRGRRDRGLALPCPCGGKRVMWGLSPGYFTPSGKAIVTVQERLAASRTYAIATILPGMTDAVGDVHSRLAGSGRPSGLISSSGEVRETL